VDALPVRPSTFTLMLLSLVTACSAEQPTEEKPTESSPQVERTLSFVAELGSLPIPPSDEVRYISIVDLHALSAANGVDIPDRTDDAAVLEWTRALAGVGNGRSLASAELPWVIRGDPAAFTSETGLSVADFRTFASLITRPEEFTVVTGNWAGIEPSRGLIEVEEGIVSVGRGRDYAAGDGSRRGADIYGRPVRLARVGARIALSLSTPMIRRWRVHRGPSLADDPALLAIAQRLDQTKVFSAYLVAPGRAGAVGAYGIGWAVQRGEPLIAGVYDAGCAEAARRLVAPLRQAFSGVLELKSILAEGRTVLVTLELDGSATVLTPLEALERNSWPRAPRGTAAFC